MTITGISHFPYDREKDKDLFDRFSVFSLLLANWIPEGQHPDGYNEEYVDWDTLENLVKTGSKWRITFEQVE